MMVSFYMPNILIILHLWMPFCIIMEHIGILENLSQTTATADTIIQNLENLTV